jgi:hypothetical protein
MHLAVLRKRMLRNPLRIAVTQDDGAVERLHDLVNKSRRM